MPAFYDERQGRFVGSGDPIDPKYLGRGDGGMGQGRRFPVGNGTGGNGDEFSIPVIDRIDPTRNYGTDQTRNYGPVTGGTSDRRGAIPILNPQDRTRQMESPGFGYRRDVFSQGLPWWFGGGGWGRQGLGAGGGMGWGGNPWGGFGGGMGWGRGMGWRGDPWGGYPQGMGQGGWMRSPGPGRAEPYQSPQGSSNPGPWWMGR